MHIKIGNSTVSVAVFEAYVGAVELSNQRAANFMERAHIAEQLSRATMPAEIISRMAVGELATLHSALAEKALRAVAQRLTQIARAETAPM